MQVLDLGRRQCDERPVTPFFLGGGGGWRIWDLGGDLIVFRGKTANKGRMICILQSREDKVDFIVK